MAKKEVYFLSLVFAIDLCYSCQKHELIINKRVSERFIKVPFLPLQYKKAVRHRYSSICRTAFYTISFLLISKNWNLDIERAPILFHINGVMEQD